jgi:hypothetical protein
MHGIFCNVCQAVVPVLRPGYCPFVGNITADVYSSYKIETQMKKLTFKNSASYIKDGRTAALQMLHFIYFF